MLGVTASSVDRVRMEVVVHLVLEERRAVRIELDRERVPALERLRSVHTLLRDGLRVRLEVVDPNAQHRPRFECAERLVGRREPIVARTGRQPNRLV